MSFMKKLAALRMYQAKSKQSQKEKKPIFSHTQMPKLWDYSMKSFDNTEYNSIQNYSKGWPPTRE